MSLMGEASGDAPGHNAAGTAQFGDDSGLGASEEGARSRPAFPGALGAFSVRQWVEATFCGVELGTAVGESAGCAKATEGFQRAHGGNMTLGLPAALYCSKVAI